MSAEQPARLSGFKLIILDIEGTVCPITFVKDILFPFALEALPGYLDDHWERAEFAQYREAFPSEYRDDRAAFEIHVRDLVTQDVKAPYLKSLQGLLWQSGYDSGELKAPVYSDVTPFIVNSHAAGQKIIIYSSGSVAAQKLFFTHTDGQPSDLSPFISGWFDTVNAGPKKEASSYRAIFSKYPNIELSSCLFLSDNIDEVKAALASGMVSLPVVRPGNAPLDPLDKLTSFAIPDFSPKLSGGIEGRLTALYNVAGQ